MPAAAAAAAASSADAAAAGAPVDPRGWVSAPVSPLPSRVRLPGYSSDIDPDDIVPPEPNPFHRIHFDAPDGIGSQDEHPCVRTVRTVR
eukprot:gene1464-15049_t